LDFVCNVFNWLPVTFIAETFPVTVVKENEVGNKRQ